MTFNKPFNFKLASLCTTIPSSSSAKISATDEDEGDDEDERDDEGDGDDEDERDDEGDGDDEDDGEDEGEGDDEDEREDSNNCDPSSGDCFDYHNGSMRTFRNCYQMYCTLGFLFISTFPGLG